MVGGQGQASSSSFLASTEVFSGSSGLWITMKPLPVAVKGLSGAKISNTVFMFGLFSILLWVIIMSKFSILFKVERVQEDTETISGSFLSKRRHGSPQI